MAQVDCLVSVVITTKNEATNITNCIKAVQSSTHQNFEIIVVDNASSDGTSEMALKYTNKVFDKGPERSAQRNFGMIECAKGKYVLYLDADMIVSPQLLDDCFKTIEKESFVALHIHERILGRGYWSKVRDFERSFYSGTSIDGARFFDRQHFIAVGGFDEELFKYGSGEDWDIDKKLSKVGTIGLLPEQSISSVPKSWPLKKLICENVVNFDPYFSGVYHNETTFNVPAYVRKKFYYSAGFDGYKKKWGREDPDIKRQLGFVYRFFGVFLEQGKWKKFFLRPRLVFGLYTLRLLVGLAYAIRLIGFESKNKRG